MNFDPESYSITIRKEEIDDETHTDFPRPYLATSSEFRERASSFV